MQDKGKGGHVSAPAKGRPAGQAKRPGRDGPAGQAADARRAQPHDRFLRLVFRDPARAAAFLRDCLDEETAALIDWDVPPRIRDGVIVDGQLRRVEADCILELALKEGRPLYMLFLVEFKSDPRGAHLQTLGYQQRIWTMLEQAEDYDGALPDIYPLVIHTGLAPWDTAGDLAELIPNRRRRRLPPGTDASVKVVRLADVRPGDFSDPHLQAAFEAMVAAQRRPMDDAAILQSLRALPPELDLHEGALTYILSQAEPGAEERLCALAEQAHNGGGEKVETLLDRYEAKGEAKGRAETLMQQLRKRFGRVPRRQQTLLAQASVADLDVWSLRVLDAPSLKAVFAD